MKLVLALLVVVLAGILWVRLAAQRQGARRRHAALDERQAALTALVGELGRLLDAPDVAVDDAERRASEIIDRMRAHNPDGQLDDFIADNEASVAETIAARRGRAGTVH